MSRLVKAGATNDGGCALYYVLNRYPHMYLTRRRAIIHPNNYGRNFCKPVGRQQANAAECFQKACDQTPFREFAALTTHAKRSQTRSPATLPARNAVLLRYFTSGCQARITSMVRIYKDADDTRYEWKPKKRFPESLVNGLDR
ncbi:hypothetical protein IF1G_01230 [Cordyceps javanica]|uniref:Uncharacterized protein n=1 Tax=Cordyceps javanica TaxID=43265 RepID=A0A545VHU2_9HYPO|nr:hypothetical protein IF1G_01230 [Cordyceps javanica]